MIITECVFCGTELRGGRWCSQCVDLKREPLPTGCRSSLSPLQYMDVLPDSFLDRLRIRSTYDGRCTPPKYNDMFGKE